MAVGLDLDQYQLKNRVVLVFAPDPRDVRYEEQREYLHDDRGTFEEQRFVTFGIFEDGPSYADDRPLSHEESARAREMFDVGEGEFALCLVDLDGTTVLRSAEPLPAGQILAAAR